MANQVRPLHIQNVLLIVTLKELGLWESVVSSYEKAIGLLQEKSELSSAENSQKESYTKKLEIARKNKEPALLKGQASMKVGQMPWDRAKTIIETLQANATAQPGIETELSSARELLSPFTWT